MITKTKEGRRVKYAETIKCSCGHMCVVESNGKKLLRSQVKEIQTIQCPWCQSGGKIRNVINYMWIKKSFLHNNERYFYNKGDKNDK